MAKKNETTKTAVGTEQTEGSECVATDDERVTIVIPKPADVVGDKETVVGLNGVLYHIKYDAQVAVPKGVAEIVAQSQKIQNRLQTAKEGAEYRAGKPSIADL